MAILLRTRKQEKGVPTKQSSVDVLKVVHPRGYIEVFREPITASHIIERYPRYCITRPDFFEFPWIVVHPESILFPGKVFYLVPHRTIHNLLKSKQQQIVQNQLDNNNKYNNHYQKYDKRISSSPIKSLAGITPKHNQHREKNDREYSYCNNDSQSQGQDSDSGSLYKPSFYKLWNKMQRNLNYETSYDQLYDDSPPYGGRPHVTSGELVEFQRRRSSCLKSADSDRNNLDLKVAFASPVITTFWL
ncbi:hypothetical protein ABFS82_14G053400 [Erythranthe guttata]